MDLSIIILSYKSKEHLTVLLPSIWASAGIDFKNNPEAPNLSPNTQSPYTAEVIVVDNDSKDGTLEWLEAMKLSAFSAYNLKVIKNQNNGFAKGNNLGVTLSNGRYILLLNPDTKVEVDTGKVMLGFMEAHGDVGMATCKIIKPDGSLDRAARRNFPNPWNSFLRFSKLGLVFSSGNKKNTYNISDATADQEMPIDSLVGAFCLTRRAVIEKIGLLDESFFMYGEDIDWCWRCWEGGYKVWYYPKTFITHYKGESSKKVPFKALKWFHEAMWIFYKKHYASKYPAVFNWFVWTGIQARLGALLAINALRKKKVVSR